MGRPDGDLLQKTHTSHTVLSQTIGKLTPVHAGAVGAVLPLVLTARRGRKRISPGSLAPPEPGDSLSEVVSSGAG